MDKTISELYYGNICPVARNFHSDEKYKRINDRYIELYEQIEAALPKSLYSVFDEMCSAINELHSEQERIQFSDGFKLGARLTAECFLYNKEK